MYTPHLNRNKKRLQILEECFLKPRNLKYKIEEDDRYIVEIVIHLKYTGSYHTTSDLIHPHEMEYTCKEIYDRVQEENRLQVIREERRYGKCIN